MEQFRVLFEETGEIRSVWGRREPSRHLRGERGLPVDSAPGRVHIEIPGYAVTAPEFDHPDYDAVAQRF